MAEAEFLLERGIYLLIDPATGCEYLRFSSFEGVTPRLNNEGKPICKGSME